MPLCTGGGTARHRMAAKPALTERLRTSRHRLVLRGVAWTTLSQLIQTLASFGTMLVLVRIIPPEEYGRAGAVVGFATLLSVVNCGAFIAQALQLGEAAEPDWSLHWSAGFYIQAALCLACELLSTLCWLDPVYRPIAPLGHLVGLGLMLDWPSQVSGIMLRRNLDFRRLQVLTGLTNVASLSVTLGVGVLGGGAYAIVLGSNVIRTFPFAIDLLVVRGWRPRRGWWRWPNWVAYAPALRFGLQQTGSGLLAGVLGALEAAVLPRTAGYAAIGFLGRAKGLFGNTIGRVEAILIETVYPLLPRYAANQAQYARHATLFAQVLLLTVVPGALYIGLEGRVLSRFLYGEKWIGADPLIWPAALTGLGLGMYGIAWSVLLAANRLRSCLVLDLSSALVSAPMIAVLLLGGGIAEYSWAVAGAEILAAAIALAVASPLLVPGGMRSALVPPALSSLLAVGAVIFIQILGVTTPGRWGLVVHTGVYGLTLGAALRGFFPGTVATVLSRLPGGERIQRWLRLSTAPAVSVARCKL